eukprot:TRINITY_DN1339_c0_g1_i1.p1 TRINITY_DN1339_c0_g1~~TRINITY_DN1339_c0_g1_i1.p1  ORF type:complete len:156 (-),score=33.15 TRINITY_DN1339_c0_g1_i1:169-636(-)
MHYLFAADDSACAEEAFRHLMHIFRKETDTLVIIHAVESLSAVATPVLAMPPLVVNPVSAEVITESRKENKRHSDVLKTHYSNLCSQQGVVSTWAEREGTPIDAIKKYIHDHPVDTLVLGTHGHNILERAVLGSVSTHFVHNPICALLIVPAKRK